MESGSKPQSLGVVRGLLYQLASTLGFHGDHGKVALVMSPDALQVLAQRVVKFVAVGLHGSSKTAQSFSRPIPAAALMKLQEDVSARPRIKPKVALRCF